MDDYNDISSRVEDDVAQENVIVGYEIRKIYKPRKQKVVFKIPQRVLHSLRKKISSKMRRKPSPKNDKSHEKSYSSTRECNASIASDFSESIESQYSRSMTSSNFFDECDISLDSLQLSLSSSFDGGSSTEEEEEERGKLQASKVPYLLPLISDDNSTIDEEDMFSINSTKFRDGNHKLSGDGTISEYVAKEEYPINACKETLTFHHAIDKSNVSNSLQYSRSYFTDDIQELEENKMDSSAEYRHHLPSNSFDRKSQEREQQFIQPLLLLETFDSSGSFNCLQNSLSYSTEVSQDAEETEVTPAPENWHLLPKVSSNDSPSDDDILLPPAKTRATLLKSMQSFEEVDKVINTFQESESKHFYLLLKDISNKVNYFGSDVPNDSPVVGLIASLQEDSDIPLISQCLTSSTDFTEESEAVEKNLDESDKYLQSFNIRKSFHRTSNFHDANSEGFVRPCDPRRSTAITLTNTSSADIQEGIKVIPFKNMNSASVGLVYCSIILLAVVMLTLLSRDHCLSSIFGTFKSISRRILASETEKLCNCFRAVMSRSSIHLAGKLSQVTSLLHNYHLDIDQVIINHLQQLLLNNSDVVLHYGENSEGQISNNDFHVLKEIIQLPYVFERFDEVLMTAVESMMQ
jgi:hypothetical protein